MGSQPTPPNPGEIASQAVGLSGQQQAINIGAQAGSMINQSDPYGSLNYSQVGTGPNGVPIYGANTSLSPVEQSLFGTYTGTQGMAGQQGQNLLGIGNYGSESPTQAIGNETSGILGGQMAGWLQAQDPFFQTSTQQLDTQLQNEGLQSGNPAYDNAMRMLQTNQTNAVAGAASQFEPQAFSQAQNLYQMPLNMSEQLAQWGAPQSPTSMFTQNTPALQAAQISSDLGPLDQAYQDQYQGQQAQYNAMMGGLFGIGSSALGQIAQGGMGALGGLGAGSLGGAGGGGAAALALM
jgi:hypothetical protein